MKNNKKIAILFWGITRSLKYTIHSIEKNIFDVLKKEGINFDTYIHTYKFDGTLTNLRSGELNEKLDFNEYTLLSPDYFEIEDQNMIMSKIQIEKYKTKISRWEIWNPKDIKTVDNFIVSSYSKLKVTELMESTGKKYDYCLFIRPDVLYINKFKSSFFRYIDEKTVCVPDFHINFNKKYPINDRMFLSDYQNGLKYGKLFEHLLEYSTENHIHSESFIGKYIYDYYNLKIKFIPFYFRRVRANGMIAERDKMILDMEIVFKNICRKLFTCKYLEKTLQDLGSWFSIILKEKYRVNLRFLITNQAKKYTLIKKRNKIIITGTGRAGTTFLVRLLTELGFDTGYTPENYEEFIYKNCNAGLESYWKKILAGDPNTPYIVKSPYFCDQISLLKDIYTIDMVIVPIRDIQEVTKSRLRLGKNKGGIMWTGKEEDQEKVLQEKLGILFADIVKFNLPHIFLKFPNNVNNPQYMYKQLSFLVNKISFAKFKKAFEKVAMTTKSNYYQPETK